VHYSRDWGEEENQAKEMRSSNTVIRKSEKSRWEEGKEKPSNEKYKICQIIAQV
jgi:hypothetical protein